MLDNNIKFISAIYLNTKLKTPPGLYHTITTMLSLATTGLEFTQIDPLVPGR